MVAKKLLAIIAGAALITGCGATDSTGTTPLVVVQPGTYTMTTINGVGLPANVSDGQSPVWVNSGSLTLDTSGKYTIEVSYQRLIGDSWVPFSDSCSGTYSRTSKALEFQESGTCTGAYAGTVQNDLLTVWLGPNLKVEYRL